MSNPFCHLELGTGDTDRAMKFYESLFGWKYKPWQMPQGGA
jgi:predicted enzyme related to lactoylglutathione lyase